MATTHGRLAQITLNALDISTNTNSITFERDNDTHDTTTFGATSHTYIAGLIDGKMTLAGFWDKTASTGSQKVFTALVGDSDGAAFVYGPEGSTTGNVKYSGTIILESYTESAPVADVITFTASLKISGAVTVGTY